MGKAVAPRTVPGCGQCGTGLRVSSVDAATLAGKAAGPRQQWTHARPLREEIASAAIQGTAAAASAAGLAYLVVRGWDREDDLGVAALIVYGATMVFSFLSSALYHGVQHERLRHFLQQVDHCTIFLLIAGTYTPVALLPLRAHYGIALLVAIWSLAIFGIVLRLAYVRLFERIAIPLYVVMGWLALGWGAPLYREVGLGTILVMIAGGMSYTGGLLFYRWHSRAFSNLMWHVSVVIGGAWFFVATSRFLPG